MSAAIWLGLLLLLGGRDHRRATHQPWLAAVAAPVMIGLVAFGYMRLRAETR